MQSRNRKGRKRKQGQRHGNGRLVYHRPDDRLLAAMQPHRRGLPEAMRLHEAAVTELGQLWLRGVINEAQHVAGQHYGRITNLYLATVGGPRQRTDGGRGSNCDPSACEVGNHCNCDRRWHDFLALHTVLLSCGSRIPAAVNSVCVFDQAPTDIEILRLGLSTLATHLRLT